MAGRGMFLVGVIPAVVAWVIRNQLHRAWKSLLPRTKTSSALQCPEVFDEGQGTTRKIRPGRDRVLTSVQNFGYYGISDLMPSFVQADGFSFPTKSSVDRIDHHRHVHGIRLWPVG